MDLRLIIGNEIRGFCRENQVNLGLGPSEGCNFYADPKEGTDMDATEVFESALQWLQAHYTGYRFFTQRDVVWTVQLRISEEIAQAGLPYRVFSDHTICSRIRTDLAILSGDNVEVAAEFKYEPAHIRRADREGDIWHSKLNPSVVFWTGEGSVARDVCRVREYVEQRNVKTAHSVFIDEGGHFRHREPHPGSEWEDWDNGVCVLLSSVER